jgi:hypothetical protein
MSSRNFDSSDARCSCVVMDQRSRAAVTPRATTTDVASRSSFGGVADSAGDAPASPVDVDAVSDAPT